MIYFIQCGTDGPIKIGQTGGHVVWRCKQLQHSSPFELHILGCHEGGLKEEAELHRRFSHARFRNEWFNPIEEIWGHIRATDAASKFESFDAADLRQKVSWAERSKWSVEARRLFRDEINKLGRTYTKWREYMGPLPADARAQVERILANIAPSDLVVVAASEQESA